MHTSVKSHAHAHQHTRNTRAWTRVLTVLMCRIKPRRTCSASCAQRRPQDSSTPEAPTLRPRQPPRVERPPLCVSSARVSCTAAPSAATRTGLSGGVGLDALPKGCESHQGGMPASNSATLPSDRSNESSRVTPGERSCVARRSPRSIRRTYSSSSARRPRACASSAVSGSSGACGHSASPQLQYSLLSGRCNPLPLSPPSLVSPAPRRRKAAGRDWEQRAGGAAGHVRPCLAPDTESTRSERTAPQRRRDG